MGPAHRYALGGALLAALLVGAVVLHQNPPEGNGMYPQCLFRQLTGWHCSGCGATRCLHAMLHLRFEEALRKNVLAFAGVPVLGFFFLRSLWRWMRHRPQPPPLRAPSPWLAVAVVVAILGFGVVRNLPWPPFTWLAPH